ncbi:Cytidine deaminase, homotetrameric [Parasponia andersonii]|uniref:Cytidine deaminase, homotetrameric n=1 Tax=Parasponia andersonii TaxID=3476 RepID=A0A2P5AEC5_PARAD|nr:Cytidine deaminase, homotetrameric [Parasponia andersonii]
MHNLGPVVFNWKEIIVLFLRRLNQIAPLEILRHVKRVQKKHLQGGKIQLSVILCVASEMSNEPCSMPHDIQELITSYKLSAFKTKVCKCAASSKEEWEEQCKLWPTSYHPPTYNIDGINGFSEEDTQSISSFMNLAINLAKSEGGSVVNAAVIVDPLFKQTIATAHDQIHSWDIAADNLETGCLKKHSAFDSNTDSEGMVTLPPPGFSDGTKQLYTGVSCLYPWGWAEQQPVLSSSCWHPLRHAAVVAIESSAARDRHLFPSLGEIQDEPTDGDNTQKESMGSQAKRQKTHVEKGWRNVLVVFPKLGIVLDDGCLNLNWVSVSNLIFNFMDSNLNALQYMLIAANRIMNNCGEDSHSLSSRPYLCTGYDIYLVWEPCTMCAMALVHQRIRRIFYAFPNPNAGALGSVYRLQGERSLNHHYAVFRVLVPEQVLDGAQI